LDDLLRAGKVRYIGASAYAAWQLAKANVLGELRGWTQFATIQSHYHMLERDVEREVLPYCRSHGVGFIPYFPLAGGFLTGKYRHNEPPPPGSRGESSAYVQRYMTDANHVRVESLSTWAAERDRTMTELALAWLLAQPGVCTVISGVTHLDQMQENAGATDWRLSETELEEVNQILNENELP
jgi:aryl-alcohol dehydrogenase-like predicted oxidoreductase